MRNIFRAVALVAGCILFMTLTAAHFGRLSGAWNTAGGDAQRTSWERTDTRISSGSMPQFQFLWKVKVNNDAKPWYSLSPAVIVDSYIGYRGFRSYAFLGGASNNVTALDTDLGRIEWTRSFGGASTAGTAACPGAMTAGVTRPTPLAPVSAGAGRGSRAPQRAESSVGEPEQGATTIEQEERAGAAAGRGGPVVARGGRGNRPPGRGSAAASGANRAPARPVGRQPEKMYAVSTDGMLRILYISNGEDAEPPVPFMPANANAGGLMLVDNVIYASTSGDCGGAPNGIWALDTSVDSPAPHHWATNGGGIAGTVGLALGTDGVIYAATADGDYSPAAFSDSVVALEPNTLKLKDWFTPGKSEFTSSPAVFPYKRGDKEEDLIAVANANGNLYLLDSTSPGGDDHKTPLASIRYANSGANADALATWEDTAGTRWILVSAPGALTALKVVSQDGKPTLQPGWVSHDIPSPLSPIVVNGIVFAVSGEISKPAVLYGFDGESGKEVFNSGGTMTSPATRSGGLAASAGQLYTATADSTVYAFGVPLVPVALAGK